MWDMIWLTNLKKNYKLEAGISDHSGNLNSLLSAVTMGAKVIETHVCFEKSYFGADTTSSITFEEFEFLSRFAIDHDKIQKSKNLKKKLNSNQLKLRKLFNKSLAFNKNIKKNTKLRVEDFMDVKPMAGIQAFNFKKVVGKINNSDVVKKQIITKKNLKWKKKEKSVLFW